jgi:hypothetical protein
MVLPWHLPGEADVNHEHHISIDDASSTVRNSHFQVTYQRRYGASQFVLLDIQELSVPLSEPSACTCTLHHLYS